jgi:hypothetical protein
LMSPVFQDLPQLRKPCMLMVQCAISGVLRTLDTPGS